MLPIVTQKYLDVVSKRGKAKAGLKKVYQNIQDRELFLMAYERLYANKGALTPGVNPKDTADGMSLKRIDAIIEKLKKEEYQWTPVRRTYIAKKNTSKLRPLGLPGFNDKLLQTVIKMVLEAYYEPQFRESSHGFRPNRGCQTAIERISQWNGTKWFIEGDIKGCFDNIDHSIVTGILKRDIRDKKFLTLIWEMLKAGYMENWKYYGTYSGTPQGGVVSPLLANIVLNELDKFVEDELIPKYTKGIKRKCNPEYQKLSSAMVKAKRQGNREQVKEIRKAYTSMPSMMTNDPDYGRLYYIRYADDTLFGFIGTKADAEMIKKEVSEFLRGIKLEMSEEKTLITHAKTEKAKFLNYEINAMCNQSKKTAQGEGKNRFAKRTANSNMWLSTPEDVINNWKAKVTERDAIIHRAELMHLSDYDIISTYEIQLQGLINYYGMAHNQYRLFYLRYLWETSLIKTLAAKHQENVPAIRRKYYLKLRDGRKVIGVNVQREGKKPLTTIFGRKPIERKMTSIKDAVQTIYIKRNELITRLLAEVCELCGKEDTALYGHHVRKLKDLHKKWAGRKEKPVWVQRMIEIRRKVLFVCSKCHREIHGGLYDGVKLT